ncbi:50S ribosomal protein L22 [Candidatus Nomurabacteria bacterium]|nr:50S ribosomal protein L22 [Candidatus Nomurabacteria bacterium]
MIKASLNNYRQSPRKVRLVADAIRGKKVDVAIASLGFISKRASFPLKKLIESAVANAKNNSGIDALNLYIKEIRVDEGMTMKRHVPMSRGRAFGIRKKSSKVSIVLDEKKVAIKAPKAEVKEVVKTTKPKAKVVKAKKTAPKADK